MANHKLSPNLRAWRSARKRYRLSPAHVQMGRELGLDPRMLWKHDNERERWKPPLAQVIEDRYRQRFGRDRPEAARTMPQPDDELLAGLQRLVLEASVLRREAAALGLFTDDRELLECPTCGLMEDVLADGRLVTCRAERLGRDTGLRFPAPTADDISICPLCHTRVAPPAPRP